RKNVSLLIDAWRPLSSVCDLILAGRARGDFTPPPPFPGLILPGAVPESSLPCLYASAAGCLYPSLYEGFVLPVLEAMDGGAPVITPLAPAIAEGGAGAAIRLNPGDARAWTEAMTALLTQPAERARRRQLGLSRASEFSWRRAARLTREVYHEA